ncbi:hypothetical protein [Roseateles sp.]|uniref:hypothetical protein n=1 Tax=Roseateles sp. TaxID=1971397 RepID=UPI0032663CA6
MDAALIAFARLDEVTRKVTVRRVPLPAGGLSTSSPHKAASSLNCWSMREPLYRITGACGQKA